MSVKLGRGIGHVMLSSDNTYLMLAVQHHSLQKRKESREGRRRGRGAGGGWLHSSRCFPYPKNPGKQIPCHQRERTQELGRRPGCRMRNKISEKFFLEVKILNITIGKGSV